MAGELRDDRKAVREQGILDSLTITLAIGINGHTEMVVS